MKSSYASVSSIEERDLTGWHRAGLNDGYGAVSALIVFSRSLRSVIAFRSLAFGEEECDGLLIKRNEKSTSLLL